MFGINKENWKKLNGFNTAKEIYNQPNLWQETLKIVESNKDKIDSFMKDKISKDKIRVIFTGAGTSAYVADIKVPDLNKEKEYIY